MARGKTEAAASKVKTAVALGGLGGSIAGPIGAGVGAITGLIIGDENFVFPLDMVAIPAFQAYMITDTPAATIYIKAGETLMATGGNVDDVTQGQIEAELLASTERIDAKKKKRKRSKWNIYAGKKANQIKFKSGKKKGLLNLKAMGAAYRKANGIKKGRKK